MKKISISKKQAGIALLAAFFLALCACSKQDATPAPYQPVTGYIDLKDTVVRFNSSFSLDLDKDGERDLFFSTQLVGDAVHQQDKQQWLAGSSFFTSLPVNDAEMAAMLLRGERIPLAGFRGYAWYNASSVVLAQKITGMSGAPYWEGNWKDARRNYLPVQVSREGVRYTGWVELSFRTAEGQLVLHRAAISKEKEQEMQAGR